MGVIDFPRVTVKVCFLVAWILPAIVMATVYKHTSSIQSRLEIAERKQRICGSHVFERETVRHVAHIMGSEDPFAFIVSIIAGTIVAASACVSVVIIVYVTSIVTDAAYRIFLAIYVAIVGGLLITLLMVALSIFRKKNISIPNQEYIATLDQIKLLFAKVHIKVDEARDSDMVIGPWERFKQVLAKRVARENSLPTIAEAEEKVETMLATNRNELIEYIEFNIERDYPTLLELVPLAENPNIKLALDKLASPNGINPLPAYQLRFRKIYIILTILMIVVGLMWLHTIRRKISVATLSMGFFLIVTIVVIYAMVA